MTASASLWTQINEGRDVEGQKTLAITAETLEREVLRDPLGSAGLGIGNEEAVPYYEGIGIDLREAQEFVGQGVAGVLRMLLRENSGLRKAMQEVPDKEGAQLLGAMNALYLTGLELGATLTLQAQGVSE